MKTTLLLITAPILGVLFFLSCARPASGEEPATTQVVGTVTPVCPLSPGWNLVTLRDNDQLVGCDTVWVYLP